MVVRATTDSVFTEFYDSGLAHAQIMANKNAHWDAEEAAGAMAADLYPAWSGRAQCKNGIADAVPGLANHQFKCRNFDLYSFKPHADLGCPSARGSGSWGWVDEQSGREFIANGCYEGTSFLEITKDGDIKYLGFLTSAAPLGRYSQWHELRNYSHYIIVGSELELHGIQIFDFKKLLTITDAQAPVIFDGRPNSTDLTSHFQPTIYGRSHNVHVPHNYARVPYIVTMGHGPRLTPNNCNSGAIFWDVTDIEEPKFLGCAGQDGYVHDIECMIYKGPDARYDGIDICYGYNEDTLTIYDITNWNASTIISRTSYTGASYTHQGAVLDIHNQKYLVLDDETDETKFVGPAADQFPVTYVWDISDLRNPKQTGLYKATDRGIDHNQYIHGDYVYQSNYGAGLRVYDVSSISAGNTKGDEVCEVGFIDIFPEDDKLPGGGNATYSGTWSHYHGFPSGYTFINTIERGAFVAKQAQAFPKCKKTCNADNCLRTLRGPSKLAESQAFCGEFTKTVNVNVTQVVSYAASACANGGNVISRVSSACACLPTA